MARVLVLALVASVTGCNSIAGVSELVDHPCAQEVCPDPVLAADTGMDTAAIDSSSSDTTGSSASDTFVADASDTPLTDAPLTDAQPDAIVPDLGLDGGVCGGSPPPLVTINSGSGGYAIASTETTRGQYAAFLAASPTITQPSECAWNTSFVPAGWTAPTSSECALPVASVDWCDAWAYCRWVGRRLCGRIGTGGAIAGGDGSEIKDPAIDEWHRVCTNNGTTAFSYGDTSVAMTCVDAEYDGTGTFNPSTDVARPVGSAMACRGRVAPFASVFDVSGNVREWENACETSGASSENLCRARGGSFMEAAIGCNTGTELRRSDQTPNVGIRCCATL